MRTDVGGSTTEQSEQDTETGSSGGSDTADSLSLRILLDHPSDQFDHNAGWMRPPARDIYQNLADRDHDMKLQPGMLGNWPFENDNSDFVTVLQEGIMFYDESSLNASHVEWFMMDYLMSGSGTSYMVNGVVDDIVIGDAYTVRMKLANPAPNLLWNPSSGYAAVSSKGAYEKHGDDYDRLVVIGSRPCRWKTRDDGRHFVLKRSEEYD